MVWRTALALVMLGCGHGLKAPLCRIGVTQKPRSVDPDITLTCHDGDKPFNVKIFDIDGWFATDEGTLRKFGEKLEQCENASP